MAARAEGFVSVSCDFGERFCTLCSRDCDCSSGENDLPELVM